MSRLAYVGRFSPTSDFFMAHKSFADGYWASVKVDNTYIDTQQAAVLSTLTTQSYVDTRDATKAKKTYVNTRDALYVPSTARGAANGVAPLNASTQVPAANVPAGIQTDRVPVAVFNPTVLLTTHTVLDPANTQEYLAATLSVVDPGWPYTPLVFGQVMGNGSTTTAPPDGTGTGTYGQAIVFDSANNVWARAATTGNFRLAEFPLVPWAVASQVPMTLSGPTTLSLYMSVFSKPPGSSDGYTFTNTGLQFWALLWPGL